VNRAAAVLILAAYGIAAGWAFLNWGLA